MSKISHFGGFTFGELTMILDTLLNKYGGTVPVNTGIKAGVTLEDFWPLYDELTYLITFSLAMQHHSFRWSDVALKFMTDLGVQNKPSLYKMVTKWLYDDFKYKLDVREARKISAVCSSISRKVVAEDVYVHIDKKIWWSAGSFGDRGSCFFDCGNTTYRKPLNEECINFYTLTAMRKHGNPIKQDKRYGIELKTDDLKGFFRLYLIFHEDGESVCTANLYGVTWDVAGQFIEGIFPKGYKFYPKVSNFVDEYQHEFPFFENGSTRVLKSPKGPTNFALRRKD